MLIRSVVISILAITLIITGAASGCEPVPDTFSATWCQEIVNKFLDTLPAPVDNIIYLNENYRIIDFNFNNRFSVLTHLSMEEGYVLDYILHITGSWGGPILYTRLAEEPPYENYSDFEDKYTKPDDMSIVWIVKGQDTDVYGNKIKIDGTKAGYYEYIVLQILGAQFALHWHSAYNDLRIVCQADEMERVFEDIEASEFRPMDDNFKEEARKINLQPAVEISEVDVTVKLVVFSKWGGFSRYSFTMYRNYPHSITSLDKEVLLGYDCGMVY